MNSYNGFSPAQRYKALAYHKAEIKSGRKPARPLKCDCCGTKQGFLAWHSEDYSEPFGPHIGEYGVCYRCHMHIHCRFRNPQKFNQYCDQIENGSRFKPYMTANWNKFKFENLVNDIYGFLEPIDNEFNISNSLILRLRQNDEPLISQH